MRIKSISLAMALTVVAAAGYLGVGIDPGQPGWLSVQNAEAGTYRRSVRRTARRTSRRTSRRREILYD